MATYITVEQQSAAQLLEASRRQTLANRQGLRDQQAASQVAVPSAARPVGRSRRAVIPGDQLAASRGYPVQHGAFFVLPTEIGVYPDPFSLPTEYKLALNLWSLDASSSALYQSPAIFPLRDSTDEEQGLPNPPPIALIRIQYAHRAQLITLPIANDRSIVLVGYASRRYDVYVRPAFNPPDPSIPGLPLTYRIVASDYQQDTAAYFVGRSTVKQVPVPSAVAALLAPAPITTAMYEDTYFNILISLGFNNFVFDGGPGFPLVSLQQPFAQCRFGDVSAFAFNGGNVFDDNNLWPGSGFSPIIFGSRANGPGVYSLLAAYDAASSLDFSGPLNSAVYNFIGRDRMPSRSLSPSSLNNDTLLEYIGPSLNEGDTVFYPPIDGIEDPVWRIKSRSLGNQPIAPASWTDPGSGYVYTAEVLPGYLRKVFITDWGRPAYCSQQLLALGFTAADLTD